MQCKSFCPITFSVAPDCGVCSYHGRCNKEAVASATNTDNGKAVNENHSSKTASTISENFGGFKHE